MATTIKLKNSVTTTNAPSSLVQGEVAINITDKKVWVGNAATTPIQLLGDGASLNFTSLSLSGNLTFTGTGNRITGDFSNATASSQVAFQSSTTNGQTNVYIAPNGTSTTAAIRVTNDSSLANFSSLGMAVTNTTALIQAAQFGSGSFLPLAIQTGGSERLRIDTSGNVGIGLSNPVSYANFIYQTINGTNGAGIQLRNNAGTAISEIGIDASVLTIKTVTALPMVFGTNNTERMRITSDGKVLVGGTSAVYGGGSGRGNIEINGSSDSILALTIGGSSTNASYFYNTTSSLELFAGSSRSMNFTVNGSERMRITSGGELLVGRTTTVGNARFAMNGSSTSNLDYGIWVGNSAGTRLLGIDNNGGFSTGVATGSPYNSTTGTAANLVVDVNGVLQRSTSSLKYKTDVQENTHGLAEVLKLRPVTYKGKNDGDTIFGGLIAEEVDAIGLTEFVQYAADGSPDALAYGNMVSLLAKAMQEQQAMIEELKQEVAKLKGV